MSAPLQVRHKITVGSAAHSADKQSRLVDLSVRAALGAPVNSCRIALSPPQDLAPKTGDPVKVELGYGDSLSLVFTGVVASVSWSIERVVVHAAGAWQRLVAARLNLTFEKPKAGDIVKDVAGRLKLATGTVEDGLDFAAYALGTNASAYAELRGLARRCGFDLYAGPDDKLVFAKHKAATTHELSFGADILAFTLDEGESLVSGVEVYGESPASQGQGPDAASWLTKQDVKGSAGGKSGLVLQLADRAARTQEAAGKIATAMLAAAQRKKRGTLRTLGNPALKLGDDVKVTKMPSTGQNGTYKVAGVEHSLRAGRGFVTSLTVEEE